jgi:outer membrane protein
MMKSLRKLVIASILLLLPALSGAAEPATGLEPKTLAVPQGGSEAQPVQPVAAAPEQKAAEPAKAERIVRIGYADLVRVGNESNRGKEVHAKLAGKSDKYKAQITAKQKQLEKQKSSLEEKLATLSPKQRAEKAKEFEKKVEEYQKFVQKAEKEMQSLQEELTRVFYREIEQAAAAYGKANGFTAICVKKDLLYLGGGVEVEDVTEALMKLVNEKEQEKSSGK